MFRAVFAHLRRGMGHLIVAACCLLCIATESNAAGCHVPDRPVLGGNLSWEGKLSRDLNAAPPALAPPILTQPPCEAEPETSGYLLAGLRLPRRASQSNSTRHTGPPQSAVALPPAILSL